MLERLLSNADGYSMTADMLAAESPNEGRGAILVGLRELRREGFLVTTRSQDAAGRWSTTNVIYDVPKGPEPPSSTPNSGARSSGTPDSGASNFNTPDSGPPRSGEPPLKEILTSDNQKQQHTDSTRHHAAASLPLKKERKTISGVTCYPDAGDVEVVTALIAAHGKTEVEEAATESRQQGGKALPSQVEAILAERAAQRIQAERAAEAAKNSALRELQDHQRKLSDKGVRERADHAAAVAIAEISNHLGHSG